MKKRILSTTLSAFVISLLGFGLAVIARYDTMFAYIGDDILDTATSAQWYVLLPAGIALVLALILFFVKIKKREKCLFRLPLSFVLVSVMYLLTAPFILNEMVAGLEPSKLLFTTGGGFVAFGFVILFFLTLLDLVTRKKEEEFRVVYQETAPVLVEEVKVEPVKVKVAPKKVEKAAAKQPPPVKKAPPKEEKPVEKPVVETKKETQVQKSEKEYDRIYHVMKRAKDDKWLVKIAQSSKAIKLFETQTEAVEYADELAVNNNGVVRVFASKGENKGKIIK